MPPQDMIRMTVEVQNGGWALFAMCDFTRQDWKQLVEQLSVNVTASPRFHPADIPDGLAAAAQAVASWPAAEQSAYGRSEPKAKYGQDNVEIQLEEGLLIFSLWQWIRMVVEMHAVWDDPSDTVWRPIVCN
jgi:hypothetical protein